MNATVERDAREFGNHVRMRGWRLGLLVARCVEPRAGQGRRASAPEEQKSKTSAAAFARAAGVSRNTVARYLAAWEVAAEEGIVLARTDLEPGVDPELDFGALPAWDEYYVPPGRDTRSPNGGDDEWYTRPEFVDAARAVLGGIDFDPASNERAQQVVRAKRWYTKETNGLFTPNGRPRRWHGRVFMNPPFSKGKDFGAHLLTEYDAGRVTAAIMVMNGWSLGARWFKDLDFHDYPMCLADGPAFYKPGVPERAQPMVWAAFVYLGREFDAFTDRFSELGWVKKDPTDRDWWKRFSRPPNVRV